MKEYLKKSNKFAIIINPPSPPSPPSLASPSLASPTLASPTLASPTLAILSSYQTTLKDIAYFTASIIHAQDKKEDKSPKVTHLHLYLEYQEKYTCKQILEKIIDILQCQKNQISVSITNSNILYIQYLTHLNDDKKVQYPFENIITNNSPLLEERYNNQYTKPISETQIILNAMEKSITLKELAIEIGIERASKYRAMFNQIREERGIFKDDIINLLNLVHKEIQNMVQVVDELNQQYLTNLPFLSPCVDKKLLETIMQLTFLIQDISTRTNAY